MAGQSKSTGGAGLTTSVDLSKHMITHVNKELTSHLEEAEKVNLDQNNISKLENLSHLHHLQQLSAGHNCLIKISGLESLHSLTVLNLPENSICAIEGIENLTQLVWLNLSGNNIRLMTNLQNNLALKHIDLSDNTVTCLGDLSHLCALKTLLLHGNIIRDLADAPTYLPRNLNILSLAENEITELCQVRNLVQLKRLEQLSMMNNPCISYQHMTHHSVSYRAFVLSWACNLQVLDGKHVTTAERQNANSLLNEGVAHKYNTTEHSKLISYLTKLKFTQPSTPNKTLPTFPGSMVQQSRSDSTISSPHTPHAPHSSIARPLSAGGRRSRSEERHGSRKLPSTPAGSTPTQSSRSHRTMPHRAGRSEQSSPISSPNSSPLISRRDVRGLIRQVIGQEKSPTSGSIQSPTRSLQSPRKSRSRNASMSPTRKKGIPSGPQLRLPAQNDSTSSSPITPPVQPGSLFSGAWSTKSRECNKCAIIIQAAWRGFKIRNLDPKITSMKQEIRARRLEDHLMFVVTEMQRQQQINAESQQFRACLLKGLEEISKKMSTNSTDELEATEV